MADNTTPFWVKLVAAINSLLGWFGQQAGAARDARLKRFSGELHWIDGKYAVWLAHERILAESEDAARALAIAQARKDFPVITVMFDDTVIVPPYAEGGNPANNNWTITQHPLSQSDIALAKEGKLGPARVDGETTKGVGLAPGQAAAQS